MRVPSATAFLSQEGLRDISKSQPKSMAQFLPLHPKSQPKSTAQLPLIHLKSQPQSMAQLLPLHPTGIPLGSLQDPNQGDKALPGCSVPSPGLHVQLPAPVWFSFLQQLPVLLSHGIHLCSASPVIPSSFFETDPFPLSWAGRKCQKSFPGRKDEPLRSCRDLFLLGTQGCEAEITKKFLSSPAKAR